MSDRYQFYLAAGTGILKHSMETLRRSVLSGQYEFPDDLYFGGKDFEPQKEILEKLFLEKSKTAKEVFLIDLHTGYGQRGHLHLFGDSDPEIDKTLLGHFFPLKTIDFGENKDFYKVTGGMVVYVGKLLKQQNKKYAGIVFEFGTLNSQSTMGSLDSIYRMTRENQLVHHGATSEAAATEIKENFHEMFYPSDLKWQQQVLTSGHKTIIKAYQDF